MSRTMKAVKLPSNDFAFLNCALVRPEDFPESDRIEHLSIHSSGRDSVITIARSSQMKSGEFALGDTQRKWAAISVEQNYQVKPYRFSAGQFLQSVTFDVTFHLPTKITQEPYDTDKMSVEFRNQFPVMALAKGQDLIFNFQSKPNLKLTVKTLVAIDLDAAMDGKAKKVSEPTNGIGVGSPNMEVYFEKAERSVVVLTGKAVGKVNRTNIFNPEWNFQKMGIGGLDSEFSTIFRRAFASRVLPPDLIDMLGSKHVRGILLYGPPGTGKTLIARQIGKMLNAREPQIVSGPSILDKYVGESEANIRKLFAAAEEEEKRLGRNSGLHIIIFDEIDAICKQRGSAAGSTGVHDTIVNQLLAKMDGVDQLNNILVIGMTNRRDMIDDALLRPGRMEVQMEISLPDEFGRSQILNIHMAKMKENNKLAADVDVKELATLTKNFSGAEIEGLVRAAQSTAINRLVKAAAKVEVDPDAADKLMVTRDDFINALNTDIKPAFGLNEEVLESYIGGGIINWDPAIEAILETGNRVIQSAKQVDSKGINTSILLLEGPPNSGKTALAAQICKNSNFPFIKVCTPHEMIGYTETGKCAAIKKIFDDAYKSELSCILVDDLEGLMDYAPVGPRFSNLVMQALRSLLNKNPPKNRKLLVVCTTSSTNMLEELGMTQLFRKRVRVPCIATGKQLVNVLSNLDTFTSEELQKIEKKVSGIKVWVGIKKLLYLVNIATQVDKSQRADVMLEELEEEEHFLK